MTSSSSSCRRRRQGTAGTHGVLDPRGSILCLSPLRHRRDGSKGPGCQPILEEIDGLSLKRKGADEPQLFSVGGGDWSVFHLSCRATKMRRLTCPDSGHHDVATGPVDMPMGDAAPAPSPAVEEERAVVLYGGTGTGASNVEETAPRLRQCGAFVRVGADWLRAMLPEAESRMVQELLDGGQEHGDDLALAVVPWMP